MSFEFTDQTLRKLQLTQVEILDEIVRVCDENDINYCLIGGTLLGAIRHKGFIPWDDDLDIAMPRADYDKFCSICDECINENYFLHSIDTDDKYWLPFAKVRKRGTLIDEGNIAHLDVEKGIYVDIFPLDDAKKVDSKIQKIRTKLIKAIYLVIVKKHKIGADKFIYKVASFLGKPFSIKTLYKWGLKLSKHHNGKGHKYYINLGSVYNTVKQTMPKDVYEPFTKVEFEGKMYKAPKDYEYVLTRIYGDYMQLPPEEKRVLRHKPAKIIFGDE